MEYYERSTEFSSLTADRRRNIEQAPMEFGRSFERSTWPSLGNVYDGMQASGGDKIVIRRHGGSVQLVITHTFRNAVA